MVNLRNIKATTFNLIGYTKSQAQQTLRANYKTGHEFNTADDLITFLESKKKVNKMNKKEYTQFIRRRQLALTRLGVSTRKKIAEQKKTIKKIKQEKEKLTSDKYYSIRLKLYKYHGIYAPTGREKKDGTFGKIPEHIAIKGKNKTQYFVLVRYILDNIPEKYIRNLEINKPYFITQEVRDFISALTRYSDGFAQLWANIGFYVRLIKITYKRPIPYIVANAYELLREPNYLTNSMINHPFISYDYNKKADTFDKVLSTKYTDYILKNGKPNSCGYEVIINVYKDSFDKHYEETKLTYETLFKNFYPGKQYDESTTDWGLSIMDILPFFKKYRLSLVVFGASHKIIFEYHPEQDGKKPNKDIKPATLYLLQKNSHFYHLNKDINVLSKLKCIRDEEKLTVSDKFRIPKKNDEECDKFIDDINQLFDIDFTKFKKINVYYRDSLQDLLITLLEKYKYEPSVGTTSGQITYIGLTISDCFISIRDDGTYDMERKPQLEDLEDLRLYRKYDKLLFESVINKDNKSVYNKHFIDTLLKYKRTAFVGKLQGCMYEVNPGIDYQKAYPSNLMDIPNFPVMNSFDDFEKYDHSELEDCTMYFVRYTGKNKTAYDITYFDSKYVIVYGYTLKEIEKCKYKILYMAKPSKLRPNNTKAIIKELFDSDLDIMNKKILMNSVIGYTAKSINHKEKSRLFKSDQEAYQYSKDNKAERVAITDDYICTIQRAKKQLTEGFYPIQLFVYDIMRMKIYKLCKQLTEKGITPIAVKTDCVYVDTNTDYKSFKVNKKGSTFEDIGTLRLDEDGEIPKKYKNFVENEILKFPLYSSQKTIELKDEYDEHEIANTILKYKRLIILADVPGAGKTQACKIFSKINHKKTLFVTPTNNLALSLKKDGFDSITLCSFLGIRFADAIETGNNKVNIDAYDCIVFDEIYNYSTFYLQCISNFMESHSELHFLATGDPHQNPPIETLNMKNPKKYYQKIVNKLFSCKLILKVNKRLANEKDKETLLSIRHKVLETNKPLEEIAQEHFKIIRKLKYAKGMGVCYTNSSVDEYNKYIQSQQDYGDALYIEYNDMKFYKGYDMLCRKYHKEQNIRLNVNYIYTLIDFDDKTMTLQDIYTNEQYKISRDLIYKFRLTFAKTCHSAQGETLEGDITICDVNFKHVNREWFWTAITRVTNFNNILILI